MTEAPNFNQNTSQAKQLYAPTSAADISAALQYISPDMDRDNWVRIGMAIQSELGDAGFDLFDTWSSSGETYQPAEMRSAWKSFKPGGNSQGTATIATVFKIAQDNGYKHQKSDQPYQPPPPQKPAETEAEAAQKRQQSRDKAKAFWDKGKPATKHPYTDKKGLKPDGLRVSGEELLVPMRDVEKQLSSVQIIQPDGKKLFMKGCPVSGCYFAIGEPVDKTLVIDEGWATGMSIHLATGLAVAVAFSSGNLGNVARLMREKYPEFEIVLAPDNDENRHAIEIAESAARQHHCQVVVPQFAEGMAGTDFDDLRQGAGLDEVKQQIMNCRYRPEAEAPPEPDYQQSIESIAKFELAGERDKLIKALAKEQGIGVVAVRHDVNNARTVEENVADNDDLKPWPEPVDGDQLLQDIFSEMDSYAYFGRDDLAKQKILTLSLYIIYTHCFDAFDYAPYLNIQSPTKRCGKNTVMNPMMEMSYRPQAMANATTAVLFRLIEASRPTLFIDEADTFLKFDPELRGILNSGWHRNGTVQRCVGDDFEVKKFSTYCPKVIAGIGSLPDTIQDRSIVIQIRRKPLAVKVKRFRTGQVDHLTILGRKAARWALDNIDELRAMVPNVPGELNDRAADVWEPLMAIADRIDGDLPDEVRQAALAISAATPDSQDIGEMLVEDLFIIFKDQDFVLTSEILEKLHAIDSRPWNEYSRGKPITPHKLGNLLKRFGIESSRRQEDKTRLRGYSRKNLEPAWQEYLGEKA